MFCTKCGNRISEGEKFCIHCGQFLLRDISEFQKEQSETRPIVEKRRVDKKSKTKKITVFLLSTVLLASAIFAIPAATKYLSQIILKKKVEKAKENIVWLKKKYFLVESLYEGLAVVMRHDEKGRDKWGYIDENGKEIIEPKYAGVSNFLEGIAGVTVEDENGVFKCSYIDKTGNEVMKPHFDSSGGFSEGLAMVVRKDMDGEEKYGFIDKSGKEVLELQYDKVNIFSEVGLLEVAKKNSDGKLVWGILKIR